MNRRLVTDVQYQDPTTGAVAILERGTREEDIPEGVEVTNPFVFTDGPDPDAELYGRLIQSPSAEEEDGDGIPLSQIPNGPMEVPAKASRADLDAIAESFNINTGDCANKGEVRARLEAEGVVAPL